MESPQTNRLPIFLLGFAGPKMVDDRRGQSRHRRREALFCWYQTPWKMSCLAITRSPCCWNRDDWSSPAQSGQPTEAEPSGSPPLPHPCEERHRDQTGIESWLRFSKSFGGISKCGVLCLLLLLRHLFYLPGFCWSLQSCIRDSIHHSASQHSPRLDRNGFR